MHGPTEFRYYPDRAPLVQAWNFGDPGFVPAQWYSYVVYPWRSRVSGRSLSASQMAASWFQTGTTDLSDLPLDPYGEVLLPVSDQEQRAMERAHAATMAPIGSKTGLWTGLVSSIQRLIHL